MIFLKKIHRYLLFFALLHLAGCRDEPDPEPIICNCSAKVSDTFNSVQGIIVNTIDGFVFLSPFEGYYEICNGLDSNLLIDGLMVSVNGELRSTCIQEHDIVFKNIHYSFVNLNHWEISSDSLFNAFPAKIKIFQSESSGIEGYGYDVQTSEGGIHIHQTIIPAIGGAKPFKTATDAFKTAVLVAYKLNTNMGLPTMTVADLQYLQVLY